MKKETGTITPEETTNNILNLNSFCIIATASEKGEPEAATIEYMRGDEYDLYFKTFSDSRKYKNLCLNHRASIVVNFLPHSLQMNGIIFELEGNEKEKIKERFMKENGKENWYNYPETKFLKFSPNWIRLFVPNKFFPIKQIINKT